MTALNWEASGEDVASGWAETWYTSIIRPDPALDRDLALAVQLDVGRDGVPVIAAMDTHGLPNWQDGAATRTFAGKSGFGRRRLLCFATCRKTRTIH